MSNENGQGLTKPSEPTLEDQVITQPFINQSFEMSQGSAEQIDPIDAKFKGYALGDSINKYHQKLVVHSNHSDKLQSEAGQIAYSGFTRFRDGIMAKDPLHTLDKNGIHKIFE